MNSAITDGTNRFMLPLAVDRPSGLAAAWEMLRPLADQRALADCLRCVEVLRDALRPMAPVERYLLWEWESLLGECIALSSHLSGEFGLAKEAYRVCWHARLLLVDQSGLRRLDLLRDLLVNGGGNRRLNTLLATLLDSAESAIRTLNAEDVIQRFVVDPRRDIRMQALKALVGRRAWTRMVSALEHPDVQIRRDAFTILSEEAVIALQDTLLAHLADEVEDWVVRWRAACLLAHAPKTAASRTVFKQVLWAPHPFVRMGAVTGLEQFGSGVVENDIVPMLYDPAPEVRIKAVQALERMGSLAVVPHLEHIDARRDALLRDPQQLANQAVRAIQQRTRQRTASTG